MSELDPQLEGYDALDLDHPAYKALAEEQQRQARQVDELIYRVFTMSDDGKRLIQHLKDRLLYVDMGPEASDQRLRHIAGKRELVLEFLGAIRRVQEGA